MGEKNDEFAARLRDLINESGRLQKDICLDLGIPPSRFSNWKTGYIEPNQKDLVQLADYFQVSLDYLLGRADDFGNVNVKAEKVGEFLSDEEKKILHKYRDLSYPWKMRVQAYIDVAHEMYSEENHKKKRG